MKKKINEPQHLLSTRKIFKFKIQAEHIQREVEQEKYLGKVFLKKPLKKYSFLSKKVHALYPTFSIQYTMVWLFKTEHIPLINSMNHSYWRGYSVIAKGKSSANVIIQAKNPPCNIKWVSFNAVAEPYERYADCPKSWNRG